MEDSSAHIISDMNFGNDKFAREAKPTKKITLANQKVLEWAHERQLPYVSNVLVYSKIPRRLPKVQQKALYSLVKGGYVRVLRKAGPPTDEDAQRESPYAEAHYVLYVDQFGSPNRTSGHRNMAGIFGAKPQKFSIESISPGRLGGDFVVEVRLEGGGFATVRTSPSRISTTTGRSTTPTGHEITSSTSPLSASQERAIEKAVAKQSKNKTGGTRSSLRAFMSQVPSDPHYFIVDGRGWIYCDDGLFHQPGLVGSDAGGMKAKRWKTEKGAETAARKLLMMVSVRFSNRSDQYT